MLIRAERTIVSIGRYAVTLLIVFTLGYAIGGGSALVLIGLTLTGRDRERAPRRRVIHHDA
jgi:hypothetical protein